MVSPEIIYLKFLIKVNKGDSQGDISCDKDRFVLIFNEVKNRWVEQLLKVKDSILIDSLQEIVKTVKLTTGVNKDDYIEFELPENFYETILATCQATQDKCKKVLYLRQVKNQDKNLLRFNVNFKPDFDFEWSFYSIQSNKIRIYKDDFSVEDATLEYYEVITDLDIEGYFHLDGTPSTNKPINLSDQYIDQIINLAAEEFERNFQNVQTLSLAKDRTNSEE